MATKLLTAAALVMGLSISTVSFAGNPKTDDARKDAKTEVTTAKPNENKATSKEDTHFYKVTGLSGTDYEIQEIPAPTGNCSSGDDACEFSSPMSLGTSAPKAQVDAEQNGISVLGEQSL